MTCEQLLALLKMLGVLAFVMSRNAKLFGSESKVNSEVNCFKQEKLIYEAHTIHRSA